MPPLTPLLTPLLALVVLLAAADTAHARRGGPALFTYGEDLEPLGEVAPEHKADVLVVTENSETKIGLLHQEFGLFWLNVWTWSPQYVIYDNNNTVWPLQNKAEAATLMGVEESAVSLPWTYTFPPGLLIIIALLALYIGYKILTRPGTAQHTLD